MLLKDIIVGTQQNGWRQPCLVPLAPLDEAAAHVEVRAIAMVMLTCTVAAIHSICSKADSNRSQEKKSNAEERLNCWNKSDWMEATVPHSPRPA